MSGSIAGLNFFNSALPNQLSFLQASAGYDGTQSAFTTGAWDYTPALSPGLLSTTLAENNATVNAELSTLTNLGAAEFNQVNNDFAGWANAQEGFVQQSLSFAQDIANKSAKAGGGLLGFLGL
jgi:hypothetical protein